MNRREFIGTGAAGLVFPISASSANNNAKNNPFVTEINKETNERGTKWIMRFSGYDGEFYAVGTYVDKDRPRVDCDYKCLDLLNQVWRSTLVQKGWIDEVPEWRVA